MPFRYTPTSAASTAQLPARTAAWICHRFFHASPRALRLESNISSNNNHYETLNVHPTATPAEIKKYVADFLFDITSHFPSSTPI